MTVWRAWLLVARRQWGARKGLVGVVLLACVVPLMVTVLASVASSSAAPRPGELVHRNLGPYQLRVQADSPEELQELVSIGQSSGSTSQDLVVTTPGVLVTASSAVEVTVEAGAVQQAQLDSRFRILRGDLPAAADEMALSKNAAVALGVDVGSGLKWGARAYRVSGIVRERSNFDSRLALLTAGADTGDVQLGDASRTHHNLYLAGAASVPELQDAYLRVGYGVLTRFSGAESVQHDDGEFVLLLRRTSIALLTLSLVIVVVCMAAVARFVASDLHTLHLLGFNRRARSLLAGSVGLLIGVVAAAVGLTLGLATVAPSREALERVVGSEWYATRADLNWLFAAVGLVVLSASAAAALWSRSSSDDRPNVPVGVGSGRSRTAWMSVAQVGGVSGVVLAAAALAVGKPTFLLVVSVLVAPALAIVLWVLAGSRLAGRDQKGGLTTARLLAHAYLSDRPAVPVTTAALTAGLLAFPITAVLMIAGIEGDNAGPVRASVPRSEMAVYIGATDLAPGELAAISEESGADRTSTWSLALLPAGTRGEQASAWVPALPERPSRACSTFGGRTDGAVAEDACAIGFRGTALGQPAALAEILGRELTPTEQRFYASGGALALDAAAEDEGVVRLIPTSAIGSPFDSRGIELPSMLVAPAAGTRVSQATPAVWLSADVATSQLPRATAQSGMTLRSGQQQAAFSYPSAVTAEVEQRLRRAIVTRVEVGGSEEFLVTRLDASRVSAVRNLLDNFHVVALLLTVTAAGCCALALGRELRVEQRVLDDLGVAAGATARWRATITGGSTAAGAIAAVMTGAFCAILIVGQEVGGRVPVSAWLGLASVLLVPALASAVAYGVARVRRTSATAWEMGFVQE